MPTLSHPNRCPHMPPTPSAVRPLLVLASLLAACSDQVIDAEISPRVTIWGGDRQTDTVVATLAQQLSVRVLSGETPVPGMWVRWTGTDGHSVRAITNASGVASAPWTLHSRAGSQSVRAVVAEGQANEADAWFSLTARPGQPAALRDPCSAAWGCPEAQDQLGAPGMPLAIEYRTSITDAHGNGVDHPIEWQVTAGGGSINSASYSGYEAYALHTLGPTSGLHEATGTVVGVPGAPQITFRATASLGALVHMDGYPHSFSQGSPPPPQDSVSVSVGASVGFAWATGYDWWNELIPVEHDLVFEDDPAEPASSPRRRFGMHTRTFETPGVYRYRCTIHSASFVSGHVGMVVVEPG